MSPRPASADTVILRLGAVSPEQRQRFASTLAHLLATRVLAEMFDERRDDPAPVQR